MHTDLRSGRKTIASYVGPRAFAPGTRPALEGLGYALAPANASCRAEDARSRPLARLVDERHVDRIPSVDDDPDTPVVLVTGSRGHRIDDDRIVARIRRPIDVQSLYPVLQRVLERTPRATPRVDTQLAARGMRGDHRWVGNVTSLSVGGCYFRSRERPPVGATISVQLALPRGGIVTARAVCARVRDDGAGLAFTESSEEARREIDAFVSQRLAAA